MKDKKMKDQKKCDVMNCHKEFTVIMESSKRGDIKLCADHEAEVRLFDYNFSILHI